MGAQGVNEMTNPTNTPVQKTPIAVPIGMAVITAIAIATAFWGAGFFGGTETSDVAGGALSADATPLAPASSAFRIWSGIYVGLILYTLWQFFPAARASQRQRALRPLALASIVLNSVWLWVTQLDLLLLSVIVIAVLLAVLAWIMILLDRHKASGPVELVLNDGVFGLYTGWVLAATFANLWAVLAESGVEQMTEVNFAIGGVIVVAAVSIIASILNHGRIAPALAVAWALAWIAIGRTEGQFESEPLWWAAAASACAVILVPAALTVRNLGARMATRKEERQKPEPQPA